MTASRISAVLVAALLAFPAGPVVACGDKFVRVGRGGRFQRGYVALHPSSILVFVNPGSAASSMRSLPATLKAAGHHPLAVTSDAAFAEALKAARYDLVLAEATDLRRLSGTMDGMVPRPEAVTVEHPEKKYEVLVGIDDVMAASGR